MQSRYTGRSVGPLTVLAAVAAAGLTVGVAPARAEGYPFCPPSVDADCFLLNRVNENLFPVTPDGEVRVIAQAHAACEFMASDSSGSNPMLDYGVWFTRQPGNEKTTTGDAAQFALYAAKAYCPKLLP